MAKSTDPLRDLAGDFDTPIETFTVLNASTQVVRADPTRWGLIFQSPTAAAAIHLTTDPPAVAGGGLVVQPQGTPLVLVFRQHGGLTQQAWHAIQGGINGALTVVEILYRPVGWEDRTPELLYELAERYAQKGLS